MDAQFREIIAEAAKRHGSVNKLCKAAGVPQSSISTWLLGKQGLSWDSACKLGDYLGIVMFVDSEVVAE